MPILSKFSFLFFFLITILLGCNGNADFSKQTSKVGLRLELDSLVLNNHLNLQSLQEVISTGSVQFSDSAKIYFVLDDMVTIWNLSNYHYTTALYQLDNLNSSSSIIAVKNQLLYFTDSGKIWKLKDSTFTLIWDLSENDVLKKKGLKVNSTFGYTLEPKFINDSLILLQNLQDYSRNHYFNKKNPLFSIFNLKNKTVSLLKYSIRSDFFECDRPARSQIDGTVVGDTLLVSYMYSDSVDLFSIKKNKMIGRVSMRSNAQHEQIECMWNMEDEFEVFRYNVESPFYSQLLYNSYNDYYYRVYHPKQERRNGKFFTIEEDRKSCIVVFNKKLEWVGEIELDDHFVFLSPMNKGVLINCRQRISKENITFKIIKHKV
jgi:hypothetical protein